MLAAAGPNATVALASPGVILRIVGAPGAFAVPWVPPQAPSASATAAHGTMCRYMARKLTRSPECSLRRCVAAGRRRCVLGPARERFAFRRPAGALQLLAVAAGKAAYRTGALRLAGGERLGRRPTTVRRSCGVRCKGRSQQQAMKGAQADSGRGRHDSSQRPMSLGL